MNKAFQVGKSREEVSKEEWMPPCTPRKCTPSRKIFHTEVVHRVTYITTSEGWLLWDVAVECYVGVHTYVYVYNTDWIKERNTMRAITYHCRYKCTNTSSAQFPVKCNGIYEYLVVTHNWGSFDVFRLMYVTHQLDPRLMKLVPHTLCEMAVEWHRGVHCNLALLAGDPPFST